MSRITFISALILVGLAASGASQSATSQQADMTVVDRAPLTLRGTGFAANERVRVIVRVARRKQMRLTASRRGSFQAAFRGLSYNRCSGLTAFAFGSRGTRAQLVLPAPVCPPSR
jgi:hypothetical protein